MLVAGVAAGVTGAVPGELRVEVGWGAAVGLLLQAPLGWWALRSIGTERFFAVWTLGMIVRFAVVGIAGLVLFPAIGGRAGPMIESMVGVLVALLLVEGVIAFRDHSREDQR
jgi:heme A synthase